MSTILLSDKHISTIAWYVAVKVCSDSRNTMPTAEHIAKLIKESNVKACNERYSDALINRSVQFNIADRAMPARDVKGLVDCWEYNSYPDPTNYILKGLFDAVFKGVTANPDFWSI